jgi:hypothetical protein
MPTVTLTKYQHELLLALAQEHQRNCDEKLAKARKAWGENFRSNAKQGRYASAGATRDRAAATVKALEAAV